MKKVLFVATVVKKHIMVFQVPYLQWFKQNGYETHVCARNDYDEKSECVIPYCDVYHELLFERSPFKLGNIKTYRKLKKIIEDNAFDVIHCNTPVGGALTRLAARRARNSGTKVIYTAHGFHFFKGAPILNWLLYYPAERYLARFTDIIITINEEDFKRAQSFKAGKIEYVHGVGVNTNKFENNSVDIPGKRKVLDIPQDAIILLSVGELNKNKNHKAIIKALSGIKASNIYYVICGVGKTSPQLLRLADKLGVSERVKFVGFRNDIHDMYAIADIYVFPSYREGLSLSLMEAMSSGLPVVCSRIRGNVDLLGQDLDEFMVRPDDVVNYINCINKLVDNFALRHEIGLSNRRRMNQFDINVVLKEMEHIYKYADVMEEQKR